MQQERRTHQPASQEVRIINTNALAERAIIKMLRGLPVPITITRTIRERDGKSYYTYQIGEKTEEQPYGLGMGATPSFLAAVRFSLQRAMQPKKGGG